MDTAQMQHSFLLKAKTLDRTDLKDLSSYDIMALLTDAQDQIVDELIATNNFEALRPITTSSNIAKANFTGTTEYDSGLTFNSSITNPPVVNLFNLTDGLDITSLPSTGLFEGQFYLIKTFVAGDNFTAAGAPSNATGVVFQANGTNPGTWSNGSTLQLINYRSYVRSQSTVSRSKVPAATDAKVNNEEIPREIISDFESNGTNVPIFTNPKCFLEGNYLIVLPDGYTTDVASVTVIYVRKPKQLVLTVPSGYSPIQIATCELPTYLHQKIVDLAVGISRETVNINDLKKK